MTSIRPAVFADVDKLVELIRSAYRGDASRAGWTSEADYVAGKRIDGVGVRTIISGLKSMMLVLVDDADDVIACCQLEDISNRKAYFGTFAVRPHAQGVGLGRRLITEAERQAVVRYSSLTLEMTVLAQQDKLIAWYERLGFHRTGEIRPFPTDPVYARPLREDLYFVVLTKELANKSLSGAAASAQETHRSS